MTDRQDQAAAKTDSGCIGSGGQVAADVPRDEHGNEATGVCMNCGAVMVENPMFPWCVACQEPDDEDDEDA